MGNACSSDVATQEEPSSPGSAPGRPKKSASVITSAPYFFSPKQMGLRPTLMKRLERAEKTGVVVLADLKLDRVPREVWAAGDKVKSLSLEKNSLKEIPPEIAQLKNTKLLNLSSNKLTALPPELCTLALLTTLDLSCNKLDVLPPGLWTLPNLVTLNLKQNQLTTLTTTSTTMPDELACGASLRHLFVSKNQLTSLPGSLFARCSALEELDADENCLEALPEELGEGGLKSLKILKVRGNKLKDFPHGIFTQTPISAIYIQNNPLKVDNIRGLEGYEDFEVRRKGRIDQLLNI